MTELAIITACSRPENLQAMYDSMSHMQTETFQGMWYIVHDAETVPETTLPDVWWIRQFAHKQADSVAGKGQVNFVLDYLSDSNFKGWIWILDDDNTMHPSLTRAIETVDVYTQAQGVAFAQQLDGWMRNVFPDTMKETFIDQAQYAFKLSLVGEDRIPLRYTGDGAFAEMLFNKNKLAWVFLTDVLCYYNALRGFSPF